jgi:hypothetical protein
VWKEPELTAYETFRGMNFRPLAVRQTYLLIQRSRVRSTMFEILRQVRAWPQ